MLTPKSLSRRKYLESLGWLATGIVLNPTSNVLSANNSFQKHFIDSHVHVWTADLHRYPIHERFKPEEMQPKYFTAEELFSHFKLNGVGRTVLIQMSYYQFNNNYMLDTIARFPGVFSGVAVVNENALRLAQTMQSLATAGIRGFRISPGLQNLDTWINSSGMNSLWRFAGEKNLAICPLINIQALSYVEKMSKKNLHTSVVIDHCARIGSNGIIRKQDIDSLCRLAAYPNLYVKISAFHGLGKKQIPYTDLAQMIQQLRDSFGAERLMWGSDAPYQIGSGHSYKASITLIRDKLDFLTPSERQNILIHTAEKVFFSRI
ncbi:MAG: amidohydrolase family protein [Pseudomonadota bacterium]